MSVAIWCPGDGLGHLTRAVAASHTLGMAPAGVTLLVDDPSAVDRRLTGDHPLDVARLPLEGVEELWVDALPSGRGELTMGALAGVSTVNHLARRLDWRRYQRLLPAAPPRFDRVLVTEPLPYQQRGWLASRSRSVEDVELHDPPALPPPADIVDLVRGSWLVVHSGPRSEVEELVATARDTARVARTTARVVVVGTGGSIPAGDDRRVAGILDHDVGLRAGARDGQDDTDEQEQGDDGAQHHGGPERAAAET